MQHLIIASLIGDAIHSALTNLVNETFSNNTAQATTDPLVFMVRLFLTTDPGLTYSNPAVISGWQAMSVAANLLMVLAVMSGGFQIMIGQVTGSIYIPVREFLPRVVAIALAVNFSFLWGRFLIDIERGLCALVFNSLVSFVTAVTHGSQGSFLFWMLGLVFGAIFVWLFFQAVERIVLIDLLLVLSPLWMLLYLLDQTQPYAQMANRLLVLLVFLQFLEMLGFGVAARFLVDSGFTDGLARLVIGIGMLLSIAGIRRILYRMGLGTTRGGGGGGAMSLLVSTGMRAAVALA